MTRTLSPEYLLALADRIDPDKLWSLPQHKADQFTPEDQDRMWAGISLRRFASGRTEALRRMEKGREFMRGFKLTGPDNMSTDRFGCGTQAWHHAVNQYSDRLRKDAKAGTTSPVPTELHRQSVRSAHDKSMMMYLAMRLSSEVSRMILLFERERTTGMPQQVKFCAHDPAPPVALPDNHLKCNLGVACRSCPHLAALEASDMTPEAKDEAKAWTCATHILLEANPAHGVPYIETFLSDKSDAAFNDRMARSFGAEFPGDEA